MALMDRESGDVARANKRTHGMKKQLSMYPHEIMIWYNLGSHFKLKNQVTTNVGAYLLL